MMNIFDLLKFDIGEFVTSKEGICIIVGIIFLLLGIILIFMNKGKNKKEETVAPAPAETPATPAAETPAAAPVEVTPAPAVVEATPAVPAVEPIVEATPVVVPTMETNTPESITAPAAEPINFGAEVTPAPAAPVAETLELTTEINPTEIAAPVTPVVDVAPVAESLVTPAVEATPVAPVVTPEVAPVAPTVENLETPAVTPVVAEPLTINAEPAQVSVYGGANPEVKEVIAEQPREIYGGANPLENTAPIPTDTVREAYQGALNTPVETIAPVAPVTAPEVAPVAPTVEATPVAPVVTPEVAPVAPAVEAAPVAPAVTPAPVAEVAPAAPTEEIEKLEF